MAKLSFRDRFFTPRVAKAITSPLGILLAGAGASIGILVGAPIAVAAGIGAAAWAARVGAAGARPAAGGTNQSPAPPPPRAAVVFRGPKSPTPVPPPGP